MKRWSLVFVTVCALALGAPAQAQKSTSAVDVHVYKTPTCGCCSVWLDHLRAHGFTVKHTDLDDLTATKAKHGVPPALQSCHTALVGGYVIEGHVPAADVQKLLKERPKVAGIAVPGMPIGSPGMEVPSGQVQPYSVFAFQRDGSTTVFAKHGR